MDKKKIIYIGSLLILTVIVSITYFSYAFFTNRDEQHGKLNIVTGTLDYKIKSADLTNNSITLEANKSKQIEIEITSLNKISSKYELYYQTTASNIVVGYGSSNDTPTGTILANAKKTVKLVIKNKSNSQATITFGVEGGFINNTLVLSTGNHITDIIDNICNYDTGYVWNFPFDPDGDGQGQVQTFTVPCNGTYKVELWGAQGGSTRHIAATGYGSYTSGTTIFNKNQPLYVYVGQEGESGGNVNKTPASSFNGGGTGNNSDYSLASSGSQYVSASGGGATDIRYFSDNSLVSSNLTWNSAIGLNSRIMVAAGGGGSAFLLVSPSIWSGAPAGGLIGHDSGEANGASHMAGATGATQTAAGITSQNLTYGSYAWKKGNDGTFGIAGNSVYYTHPGGGGGAGYYGGASGGSGGPSAGGAGGSGGSSYISGHTGCVAIAEGSTSEPRIVRKNGCTTGTTDNGCSIHYSDIYFTDTNMIDGAGHTWTNIDAGIQSNNLMPNPNGGYYASGTGHTGNGYARITYLGE